jgi:hypothetical protein
MNADSGTVGEIVRGGAEYHGPSLAELWDSEDADTIEADPSDLSADEQAGVSSYPKALHKWLAAGAPEGEAPVLAVNEHGVTAENVERWINEDVSGGRKRVMGSVSP